MGCYTSSMLTLRNDTNDEKQYGQSCYKTDCRNWASRNNEWIDVQHGWSVDRWRRVGSLSDHDAAAVLSAARRRHTSIELHFAAETINPPPPAITVYLTMLREVHIFMRSEDTGGAENYIQTTSNVSLSTSTCERRIGYEITSGGFR